MANMCAYTLEADDASSQGGHDDGNEGMGEDDGDDCCHVPPAGCDDA